MNRYTAFLFAFILLISSAVRAGNSFVFLGDTTKLFFASNNEIYSPDKKQLLYFQKGNIFFNGAADSKENIFLLSTSMDIGSDKLELLYEKDNRQPSYSFTGNKFYLGKTVSEDLRQKTELIHIQRIKKWLSFYASATDSLLAYYAADSLPGSTAIIVAYTLVKNLGLEKSPNLPRFEQTVQTNTYSTIKPIWGNQTMNEWMWDGKILRPRWNVDPKLAWTFDGQTIKPQFGNNIYAQYSWDGEIFKPVWRSNRNEEWSWDGRLMKPIWETDWANQYIIEDGVVKPWSNVHTEKEWQMQGDIPIPLIILILSGIARPY